MFLFASIADNTPRHREITIDETLLSKIAKGNQQAFTALYREAGQTVYAYALSMLRNSADAEDMMQDTFLKIRSAASFYQPQGKPMAWILTITRNLCLMKLRRQQYILPYDLDEAFKKEEFNQIHAVEDRIVLQSALKILSEEESQIIMLHAVTGWKHREIAELLKIPVSTVLSKYRRGLHKLKAELEGKV